MKPTSRPRRIFEQLATSGGSCGSAASVPAAAAERADTVIRGALLVDGTGKTPAAVGDLAVTDGIITHVGVACQENQYVQDVPGDESRPTEVL